MDTRGTVRSSSNGQRKSIVIITIRRPGCARSSSHFINASGRFNLHRTDNDRASASLIGDDRDHHLPDRDRTVQMFHGRIPRSRFYCDAIVANINSDYSFFITKSSHEHQAASSGESRSRSWPDRRLIVARFATKLKPRSSSTDQAVSNTDRDHQSVSTIASNGLKIGPIFPFKSMYFPHFVLQLLIDS